MENLFYESPLDFNFSFFWLQFGTDEPKFEVPHVVEAREANKQEKEKISITMCNACNYHLLRQKGV